MKDTSAFNFEQTFTIQFCPVCLQPFAPRGDDVPNAFENFMTVWPGPRNAVMITAHKAECSLRGKQIP